MKAYKLSLQTYEDYVFLACDGVCFRKRNIDAIRAKRDEVELKREIEERAKRLRADRSVYQPFAAVPEAELWKELFAHDALRYPLLVVLAPSHVGKTEFAKSLFHRPFKVEIGSLQHFPDRMRGFDRKCFDALILDDVRDLAFLAEQQEKLQGNYEAVTEFASTTGGTCTYYKDLWKVPVVATVNFSTRNLEFLTSHDYLSKKENVHLLNFSARPGEVPPKTSFP